MRCKIITLCFLLISCGGLILQPETETEWICYQIPKGHHDSTPKVRNAYSQVYFQSDLSGAWYENEPLGIDSLDWNKLYGLTSTRIHANSYRIGYRINDDLFEFAYYDYYDGNRSYGLLGVCSINDTPSFLIDIREDNTVLYWMHGQSEVILPANKPKHLFISYPYFGGNQPASSDLTLCVREFHVKHM